MEKNLEIQKEMEKLIEIFKNIDENTLNLIQGLLSETAYLKVELNRMREILDETGMIQVHPQNKNKQKSLAVANEYRRTLNIYMLNIKTLSTILNKKGMEEEDLFEQWANAKKSNDNTI